jgi:hypothetical protein
MSMLGVLVTSCFQLRKPAMKAWSVALQLVHQANTILCATGQQQQAGVQILNSTHMFC